MSDHTDKVLALLAKAERTEFPDEAEAFYAKAQQLMTRHAIDMAMVDSARAALDDPVELIVINIAAPYKTAKGSLLASIGMANSCDGVTTGGRVHMYGHRSDLANVEMLFTALSMHATRTMLRTATPPGESTKSFRHAFLLGFAARIGERLRDAQAAVVHGDAASAASVALVLADRKTDATAARDADHPHLSRGRTPSYSSRGGLRAGAAAADRADLGQRGVGEARRAVGA